MDLFPSGIPTRAMHMMSHTLEVPSEVPVRRIWFKSF